MVVLKRILKIVAAVIIGLHLFVYFYQEKLIFRPGHLPADFRYQFSLPFEEISVPRDGAVLNAIRFRTKSPKGIILYFHGNAGTLNNWGEVAANLSRFGYDVLIYDYRGYGKSTGRIRSEAEFIDDGRAMLSLARKEFADEKIILFGRSIGTGIAVQLAAESKPKRLLLESGYPSVLAESRNRYPFLSTLIVRYPLRNDLFAAKVSAPVVLFHGEFDEIFPLSYGETLAKAFNRPVTFRMIKDGHHNDLGTFPEYRDVLAKSLVD